MRHSQKINVWGTPETKLIFMVFGTFGLQASRSDTTKVLYVLRFRALRIDSREKFHGFKNTCSHQIFFNILNSKNGENGIRIAFSCLHDAPQAKPWTLKIKPWTLKIRAQIQAKPGFWTPLGQPSPRCFKDTPKMAPGRPKMAPRQPKMAPRSPITAPLKGISYDEFWNAEQRQNYFLKVETMNCQSAGQ